LMRHLLYTLDRRFRNNDKGNAIVNMTSRAIEAIASFSEIHVSFPQYAATGQRRGSLQMGWITPGDEGWHRLNALKKQKCPERLSSSGQEYPERSRQARRGILPGFFQMYASAASSYFCLGEYFVSVATKG
jgi:hypothetical protein